ncbi:hypothetical protein [Bradyrhizobium japonicum]|uniref:hypothetical protein n=1 Tax=Bradyrhizobium japonicum TaxID=375 RepID=UPI000408260D|nr:hypothetical protein [Bradyrhizobium japonicum]
MSNSTAMPGHEPRQDGEARLRGRLGEGGAPIESTAPAGGAATHPGADHDGRMLDVSSPIVRALVEISPLRWWRSMPADAFRAAEYLAVRSTLEEVTRLIEGAEVEPALQGDAEAAIALARSLMPITRLGGIKTDIAMTALLSLALEGEPRCALVLAHVIDRAEHDAQKADQLCGSWLAFRFGRSARCGGFSPAETALLKTLRAFDALRPGREGRA